MSEIIGSDLDGTVRQPLEPFNSWRDTHPWGFVRLTAGIAATVFARRINRTIDADVYITGSPGIEDLTTKLWLKLHGMNTRLFSNTEFKRTMVREDPVGSTAEFKARTVAELGCTWYYEDQGYQAAYVDAQTTAHVVLVKQQH